MFYHRTVHEFLPQLVKYASMSFLSCSFVMLNVLIIMLFTAFSKMSHRNVMERILLAAVYTVLIVATFYPR